MSWFKLPLWLSGPLVTQEYFVHQPSVSKTAGSSRLWKVCISSKHPHPYPCGLQTWSRGNSYWCLIYRCLGKKGIATASGLNSVVWLVITHKPWLLILCTDSWAILKGLTLWFRQWKAEGWKIMNKSSGVKKFGLIWKSLRQSSLSFTFPLIKHWYPLAIWKLLPHLKMKPSDWHMSTADWVHLRSVHCSASRG